VNYVTIFKRIIFNPEAITNRPMLFNGIARLTSILVRRDYCLHCPINPEASSGQMTARAGAVHSDPA